MKRLFFYSLFFTFFLQSALRSQTSNKPKLVVGIVIDQMRNDYIYRYWDRYSKGGFKRLVEQGFYFKNTHYNYTPTYTGPGHASIYTGTTPRYHGIIANDWYVKDTGSSMYCAQDSSVTGVGSSSKSAHMSPKNLLSSTLGDEIKTNTLQHAKVFSIALKDRAAVLPGGHTADAAFWFDDATGNFISSTWYINELPLWLKTFNSRQFAKHYLEKGWSTLYPIETYTNSLNDSNSYEAAPANLPAVFPYSYTAALATPNYAVLKASPYGSSITKDLAMECILHEDLGKDEFTDLLTLSFSNTDYVGHAYGIRSIEIEDIYLRLDKDLESLLLFLDKHVGKGNYSVFLTADHGAAEVPAFLNDLQIPAGTLVEKDLRKGLKNYLFTEYNDSLLLANLSNEQIFLNEQRISNSKLDLNDIQNKVIHYLVSLNGIAEAYPSSVLKNNSFESHDHRNLLQNGYHHKMSGHICFVYAPAWIDHGKKGTTHGSGYTYDTHVPLLFYGKGIKKGESYSYTTITQIAPTICELLKMSRPNACFSDPLPEVIKK